MNHPYKSLERTQLWNLVDAAVQELEQNKDLVLTTTRQHVVGYLSKRLVDQGAVSSDVLARPE